MRMTEKEKKRRERLAMLSAPRVSDNFSPLFWAMAMCTFFNTPWKYEHKEDKESHAER